MVMMPDGFLWQKKKMSTDFDIRHYNPVFLCPLLHGAAVLF